MPGGLRDVSQRFDADAAGYLAELQKIIRANREVLDSVRQIQTVKIDADISGFMAKMAAAKAELGSLHDKTVTVTVKYVTVGDKPGAGAGAGFGGFRDMTMSMDEARRALGDFSGGADAAAAAVGRTVRSTGDARESVRSYTRDVQALTEAIGKAGDASNSISAAGTREFLRGMADARSTAAAVTAASAGILLGGGGGGGGGGGLGGAAAAIGGGGGRGPDPGTAAATFATAAGFVRRWYPAFHWAMMLSNELLATVGPAVVAAGAAGAVGLQGGQQVANRLQAVYAVAESLGPSLGTTTGQFLGGGNALQRAQNIGGGGVYELLGAGVNIAKTSASGSFAQLGLNTEAMLDRFAATLTADFKGGMGNQLAGLVAGGTGYLQQIGDIGANIGRTFLNVAPNLPGVGGDLLTTLQGATGGLRAATGWLGPALGPVLGYEAGARWGPALVGGAGKLLTGAGTKLVGAAGADSLLGGAGIGLAGAGEFLGGLTAPTIGTIAALTYMTGKGITYKDPFQQSVGAMLSQVAQGSPAGALPDIISSMGKLAKVPYSAPQRDIGAAFSTDLANLFQTGKDTFKPGGGGLTQGWGFHPGALVSGTERAIHGFWSELTGGTTGPTNFQVAQSGLDSLSHSMVNALGTGKQVQGTWKGLSGDTLDMASAYNVATMAQLQLGSAFEKNGKLTSQAKQMIANLYAGYAPMVMNTGQFGAATGAVTAMGGLSKTQLSTVNSAYDQLTQIVSGGASGAAAYSGLVAALPAGTRKALTSFTSPASATSPGSAAAWSAFASTTQPSVISSLQQQTDWQRTAQTLGALGPGQTTGMTAYLLGQALPSAKSSPAALSMLSSIAQQYGGPAVRPGESAAAMFHSLNHWVKQFGDTGAQFNKAMTTGTEKLSSIPRDAQQFVQTASGDITSQLAMGIATYGSGLQQSFMSSVGGKGGYSPSALSKYAQFLKQSGVPEQGALDMAKYAGQISGASGGVQAQIAKAIQQTYTVTVKTHVEPAKPPKVPDQTYAVFPHFHMTQPPKIPDQSFNIVGHVIISGGTAGIVGGGGARFRSQTGMLVPGHGSGDIVPIMAEPGELVVPKGLVGSGAVDHLRGKIPGFQSGGLIGLNPTQGGMVTAAILNENFRALQQEIAALARSGGSFSTGGALPMPAAAQQVIDAFEKTFKSMSNPWGQFATTVLQSLLDSVKNPAKETAAQAKALTSRVTQEVNYAKSVSATAVSDLNLPGMQVATPTRTAQGAPYQYYTDQATIAGGGSVSVQGQMGDYLQAIKSFGGDIKTLGKQGLNKQMLQQLLGAGPIQGDAMAQSILSGPGGAKEANKLWKQIQQASNQLGITGAEAVYGVPKSKAVSAKADVTGTGAVHALQTAINTLQGKTVVVKVVLDIESAGGGGGGGGGGKGNVPLTNQVEHALQSHLSGGAAARHIQTATLKQAKRTGTSGLRLPGYAN